MLSQIGEGSVDSMRQILQTGTHLVVQDSELVELRAFSLLNRGLRAAIVELEAVLVVDLLPLKVIELLVALIVQPLFSFLQTWGEQSLNASPLNESEGDQHLAKPL